MGHFLCRKLAIGIPVVARPACPAAPRNLRPAALYSTGQAVPGEWFLPLCARKLGDAGLVLFSFFGADWSGNQTWLAGKSTRNEGVNTKIICKYDGFSIPMLAYPEAMWKREGSEDFEDSQRTFHWFQSCSSSKFGHSLSDNPKQRYMKSNSSLLLL